MKIINSKKSFYGLDRWNYCKNDNGNYCVSKGGKRWYSATIGTHMFEQIKNYINKEVKI